MLRWCYWLRSTRTETSRGVEIPASRFSPCLRARTNMATGNVTCSQDRLSGCEVEGGLFLGDARCVACVACATREERDGAGREQEAGARNHRTLVAVVPRLHAVVPAPHHRPAN